MRSFFTLTLFLSLLFPCTLSAQDITIREAFGEPNIFQVEFSPNGEYLYATDAYSNILRITLGTGELDVLQPEHQSTVRAMLVNSDDELVTIDMAQQLCRWSGNLGVLRRKKDLTTEVVTGFAHMAINPRTAEVLLGGSQLLMFVPLLGTEQPKVYPSELGFISAVAYSSSGSHLAISFGEKETQIFPTDDLEDVKSVSQFHTHSYALAFSPDGERLYFTDGRQLGIQALEEDRSVYSRHSFSSTISALEMSGQGLLAIGTVNGQISLLDAQSDSLLFQLRAGQSHIHDIAFSRDGLLMVIATNEGIYWVDVRQKRWLTFTTTMNRSSAFVHFSP